MRDTAALFDILARPDHRDYGSLPPLLTNFDAPPAANVKGWRVGLMKAIGYGPQVDHEIERTVSRAAAFFAESGAIVELVETLVDLDPSPAFEIMFGTRARHEIAHLSACEQKGIHPALHALLDKAATFGVEDLLSANDTIERAKVSTIERTHPYDVVISPATPIVAFPAEEAAADATRLLDITTYTALFNQTGQPAAVICGGFSRSGMPIGVQLIGRRHEDIRVLQAAEFCETALALKPQWPF